MRVKNYTLEPWISGNTSAGLSNVQSKRLLLNDKCISRNIPEVSLCDNLMQIELCEECFQPGCRDGGYIQIFFHDQFVIWKEPYSEENRMRDEPSSALLDGTIFWDVPLHSAFTSEMTININRKKLTRAQAFDLWRINAVKEIYTQLPFCYFDLDRIEEDILGFYSVELAAEQSEASFYAAKKKLLAAVL